MLKWSKLALGAGAIALLCVGGVAALDFRPNDTRIRLRAGREYTQDAYLAYVSPWGAGQALTGLWGSRADSIRVDPAKFPANSRIGWRWPPFGPPGELSIWGYDHLAFGDYDGGLPEQQVEPRRVSQIQRFEQAFRWKGSFEYGAATLLTEFYLRRDPADADSKTLEIGWFLHAPEETRRFVAEGKQLGDYQDPSGRLWQVAQNKAYLTFLRKDGKDTVSGKVDMLHALRWLEAKGLVKRNEWVTGLALGVEPMKGVGSAEIENWQVWLE
jgi:hypothetical protein